MGNVSYEETFEKFHQFTAENVGLITPSMFGELRVREIDVVDDIMCCAATRYRGTPEGVIRVHLEPGTLKVAGSPTYFEPGDEAAELLQGSVKRLLDDYYRDRPSALGHRH